MARATLKQVDLEVHQVTGDATRVQTAYGVIEVPQGHYVIYFPGEFELATALPPDTFAEMFLIGGADTTTADAASTDTAAAPTGTSADTTPAPSNAPATDTTAAPATDTTATPPADTTAPETTTTTTDTAATGGPTDTTTAAPADTTVQAPTPDTTAGIPAPGVPTEDAVSAWVAGHYAETYRQAVIDRLMANPTRAQELLTQYPLPETTGQAPPPDQI